MGGIQNDIIAIRVLDGFGKILRTDDFRLLHHVVDFIPVIPLCDQHIAAVGHIDLCSVLADELNKVGRKCHLDLVSVVFR